MSKKVVPFRMPGKPAARSGGGDHAPDARAAAAQAKPRVRRSAAKADDWVQRREGSQDPAPSIAGQGALLPAIDMRSWTIDLSAERDATEVMALALFVPPMLGWFWFLNMASRYWSKLG